jgi:hypothetical protein
VDESGSWFTNSTQRVTREPEQDSPGSFFQERRVPGQSLQSAPQAEESPSLPPRFEPPGFRDEPPADFDEPSRATMRTRRGQPRFDEADEFGERARVADQPSISQVPGFGEDSRGPRAREDFGERARHAQPSARFFEDTDPDERTRLNQPRFGGDSAGPERGGPSQPRFANEPDGLERTRRSQPRFADDTAGPERTQLSQPRFEEPDGFAPRRGFSEPGGFGENRGFGDSPRFDDEADARTVKRQDLESGPGFGGTPSTDKVNTSFGGDHGFDGDHGFEPGRGFDSTRADNGRGYGGPRTFDGPAAFGTGPASSASASSASAEDTSVDSQWTFRDTGPDTGAFQGSYGGNGRNAGNGGYGPTFRDQDGPGFPGGTAAPGSYTPDDRGFFPGGPSGQGGQAPYPGPGSAPAERKRGRKVPVLIGAGVLVVALGAGGAVVAPKFLKHTDPGCTAYTSNALPAYNHAISDLNAQASQATLESDLATAIGDLTTASGQASGTQVKTALQGLLTQLKEVQADVKKGAVPDTTVTSLNTASTAADNAC